MYVISVASKTPTSTKDIKKRHADLISSDLILENEDDARITSPKTIESGFIPSFRSTSVVLCFQSEPFWLFALHSTFMNKVYAHNAIKSFSELHNYLSLYENRRSLYNKTISRLVFN